MTAPILMAALCSFWGCDKDEDHLSEAVLASANTLNFEAERAAEKIITIYADADWVTVTPNSGTGVMDVTVSVTDNMRDGAEDNPPQGHPRLQGTDSCKPRTGAHHAERRQIPRCEGVHGR